MPPSPDIATIMRTLADPTRRTVFERIVKDGEVSAITLVDEAEVSQPAVSQHLRVLREAGLIAERREGRQMLYRAESKGLAPLVDWLGIYGVFWRQRFANLKKVLKEMDRD